MMKNVSRFCLTLILMLAVVAALPLLSGTVLAQTAQDEINKAQCVQVGEVECFQNLQDPAVNQDCSASGLACNIVDKYINPAIALIGILGGIAAAIGIIVGGIQYASSGGDPQKAAAGKKHIKMAVIALIGLLFLYSFLRFLMPSGTSG